MSSYVSAATTIEALPAVGAAVGALIPLWVKIAFTVFMVVMVPFYWRTYTPWNFLYFCDVAMVLTLVGIWTENRLLISMQAVSILVPQMIWLVDVVTQACGLRLIGLTDYMFNPAVPVFARVLSSFHGWLPLLLLYLINRVGYDGRAFAFQCAAGVGVLWVCYLFAPKPPALAGTPNMAVNLNYVWGVSNSKPQTWMSPGAWMVTLCALYVGVICGPAHLVLRKVFAGRE